MPRGNPAAGPLKPNADGDAGGRRGPQLAALPGAGAACEIEQNFLGQQPDPYTAAPPKTITAYYGQLAGRRPVS